jgi:outer membrane protein OmpA-like peptidoglycan-associated protein
MKKKVLFDRTKRIAAKTVWIVTLLALFVPMGCAPTTRVILLPDPDSKVGVIDVSSARGVQTLDRPWQTTEVSGADKTPSAPSLLPEKEVREMFKEALAAEPLSPAKFIVYFGMESYELTAESLKTLSRVFEEIEARRSTDIVVSGNTDAVGSAEINLELSLKRAKAVVDYLVGKGIKPEHISVTYHGKGNPLVPARDGVPEPRNRRTEIVVR